MAESSARAATPDEASCVAARFQATPPGALCRFAASRPAIIPLEDS